MSHNRKDYIMTEKKCETCNYYMDSYVQQLGEEGVCFRTPGWAIVQPSDKACERHRECGDTVDKQGSDQAE